MYITDNLPLAAHNPSGHQANVASLPNHIFSVDDECVIGKCAEARHDEVDPLDLVETTREAS
jgi:hypothetical protein